MPDLRYRMIFTLEIDEKEFKIIGKGLAGKLTDRIDKLDAAILLAKLMSARQRVLEEQQEQAKRIGVSAASEIATLQEEIGTEDTAHKSSISSAASGSEVSSET